MEEIDVRKLIDVCRKYKESKVALFGSFARGDAGPDSDIDLLTEQSISPYLRDQLLSEQKVIYEEAG